MLYNSNYPRSGIWYMISNRHRENRRKRDGRIKLSQQHIYIISVFKREWTFIMKWSLLHNRRRSNFSLKDVSQIFPTSSIVELCVAQSEKNRSPTSTAINSVKRSKVGKSNAMIMTLLSGLVRLFVSANKDGWTTYSLIA